MFPQQFCLEGACGGKQGRREAYTGTACSWPGPRLGHRLDLQGQRGSIYWHCLPLAGAKACPCTVCRVPAKTGCCGALWLVFVVGLFYFSQLALGSAPPGLTISKHRALSCERRAPQGMAKDPASLRASRASALLLVCVCVWKGRRVHGEQGVGIYIYIYTGLLVGCVLCFVCFGDVLGFGGAGGFAGSILQRVARGLFRVADYL